MSVRPRIAFHGTEDCRILVPTGPLGYVDAVMYLPQALNWLLAARAPSPSPSPEPAVFGVTLTQNVPEGSGLTRRDAGPFNTTSAWDVNVVGYMAQVKIGTPPQSFKLELSSTLADTWVNSKAALACLGAACTEYGSFDRAQSSSYRNLSAAYTQSYASGWRTGGSWMTETITLGKNGITITDQHMGLALIGNFTYGQLGLAWPGSSGSTNTSYKTVMQQLYNQGRIKSQTYSMYLSADNAGESGVLFGGVDTSKFSGRLGQLKAMPRTGKQYIGAPIVTLTDLSVNGVKFISGEEQRYVLSTETMVITVPSATFYRIADALKAKPNETDKDGLWILPCLDEKTDTFANFTFESSTMISIPLDGLAWKYIDSGQCVLGVRPAEPGQDYVLGLPFLRQAYVVVDQKYNTISLGQAVWNSTRTSVLEIEDSANAPAKTATGYVAPPPPANSTAPPHPPPPGPGLSGGAIAGIAIGAASGIGLLAAAIFFFWRRRRNAKNTSALSQAPEMAPQHGTAPYSPSTTAPGHMSYISTDKKSPILAQSPTSSPIGEYNPQFAGYGAAPGYAQHQYTHMAPAPDPHSPALSQPVQHQGHFHEGISAVPPAELPTAGNTYELHGGR